MARVLVEKETIYNEEVMMLVKGASYQEVFEYMDKNEGKVRDNIGAIAINPAKEAMKAAEATSVEEVQTEPEEKNTEDKNDQE